jgi:hypothetical protein
MIFNYFLQEQRGVAVLPAQPNIIFHAHTRYEKITARLLSAASEVPATLQNQKEHRNHSSQSVRSPSKLYSRQQQPVCVAAAAAFEAYVNDTLLSSFLADLEREQHAASEF